MKASSPRPHPLATALLAALFLPASLLAQTATTDPVGFVTVSASNKPTSAGGYNFLSLPLNRALAYQGLVPVGGVSSGPGGVTVLTFSPAPFTQDQFNGPTKAHYLEILNGPNAGELSDITATSTSSITLADNIAGAIAAGTTTFRIWPHWTFASAFGSPNQSDPAAILGGTSASVADVLTIIEPSVVTPADQVRDYYYNTANSRWQRASDESPANDSIIRRDVGIQYLRRNTGTPANFVVMGAVKTGPTGIVIEGGAADVFNLISNPYPLTAVRLDQSGLYTGNASTGVVGGTAADADLVRILDPQTGLFTDFFYETSTSKWKTGFTDASLYTIPLGASAAIIRKAGRSSFTWYSPQPTMNLNGAIPAFQLLSAVSRKTHPGAGVGGTNFDADVNLSLTGTPAVEPRTSAVAGTHSIIFTFSNPVANPGTANLTAGIGVAGSPIVSGNQIIVALTGVSDIQSVTLTLNGVSDTNGQTLNGSTASMRLLAGDVKGEGSVSLSDLLAVKSALSQQIQLGNFKADINVNNSVSLSDLLKVKSNLSQSVP